MAVPNSLTANANYLKRVKEITKLADWRRRLGQAFVVISPFYGLAKDNLDINSLASKPGVLRSTIFGDDTQEAYMVWHNLAPETFNLAYRSTPFDGPVAVYHGAPVDVTPYQAEAISCMLAEHFTGMLQAPVADVSLFSDICDESCVAVIVTCL